jgi:hypothetical protein
MNLAEMITATREDWLLDTAKPYLWTDDQIKRAINGALVDACRRARLIVDASTFSLTFDGPDPVRLDDRIIFIRRAIVAGASRPLRRASIKDLDAQRPGWEDEVSETPTHYVVDAESMSVRLYPAADGITPITAKLTVVREPLSRLENDEDVPEIPSRYHGALLHGACKRLFQKPDADAEDQRRAAYHEAEFEVEFGKKSAAIDEVWIRENYEAAALEGVF